MVFVEREKVGNFLETKRDNPLLKSNALFIRPVPQSRKEKQDRCRSREKQHGYPECPADFTMGFGFYS